MKYFICFRSRSNDSVQEMNIQNTNTGVNGNSEQNGLKIKTDSDDIRDEDMETQSVDDKNGHTNGYQNGSNHDDYIEDMGEFRKVAQCFC